MGKMIIYRLAPSIAMVMFLVGIGFGQCGSSTPTFNVDLSNDPNATWSSPPVVRADTCCGSASNAKCIKFVVTLNPLAEGIIFDICDGAIPPGALFYQVGCGPISQVGEALCLSGPGPHVITFCKPGNNTNIYCITSIAEPAPGPAANINDGCSGFIYVQGYDPDSVQWTSIYPGAAGAYDSYLDCTFGCDTVHINGQATAPDTVLYQVCGPLLGDCDSLYYCDTIPVYFHSTLGATINPIDPTVCFGATGTSLYAIGSGGSPPYNYTWSTGDTLDSIFVNVGTYYLTLGDVSGCPPTFDTITVTSFSLPIEAIAGNDTTICENALPVSLSGNVIAASGGMWSGGAGVYAPNASTLSISYTPTAAEISAGSVQLYLETTGNGSCPADIDTVEINFHQFNTTYTLTTSNLSCFEANDGWAALSFTGGTEITTVIWSTNPVQNGDSALNLAAGSYSVTLVDSFGCDSVISFVITQPDSIVITLDSNLNVTCNGLANGGLYTTTNGGISPYTYLWSNGATTEDVAPLAAGTYGITVTDLSGCQDSLVDLIVEPTSMIFTPVIENISCYGLLDGSASIGVSGGTPGYNYLWSSGQTVNSISGLAAGLYTLTITDAAGCFDTIPVEIVEPDSITISLLPTQISCFGETDGAIIASAIGGTGAYTFSWSNGSVSNSISGLAATTYTITITDSNGCINSTAETLTEPTALTIALASTPVICFDDSNGSATVTVNGGTLPYSYNWTNGSTTTNAFNLAAGTYTALVTDSHGCEIDTSLTLSNPPLLVGIGSGQNLLCYNDFSGTAQVQVSGGVGSYSYSWNTGSTASAISGLAAALYQVVYGDSLGCFDSVSITITQPDSLQASTATQYITCFGFDNGVMHVNSIGGTLPYTYNWSSSVSILDSAANLQPGQYAVTITDSNGCNVQVLDSILEPTPLQMTANFSPVTCNGFSDGAIGVSPSGATAPYNYAWSSGQIVDSISNLNAGTYSASITDANGCAIDTTINLIDPPVLVGALNSSDLLCYNDQSGWAMVSLSGGFAPYSYAWNTGGNLDSITGLSIGFYEVVYQDSIGCTDTLSVTLTQPDSLQAANMVVPISCFGADDGQMTVQVIGGTLPYTYQWPLSVSTSASASNLQPGNYQVLIADSNNCLVSTSGIIIEPTPLNLNSALQTVSCFGLADGFITASPSGGTMPYTYAWTNGVTTDSNQNLPFGFYNLTVTDAHGCIHDSVFYMSQPQVLAATLSKVDLTCNGDFSGSASVNPTGGTTPYFYNWSNGSNSQSINSLAAGTYSITVSDTNGCQFPSSISVNQPTKVQLTTSPNMTICKYDSSQVVTATASGGNGSYSYNFGAGFGGINTYFVNAEVDSFYVVQAQDFKGCLSELDTVYISIFPIVFGETQLDASPKEYCQGEQTTLNASYSGSTTGYTFGWSHGLGSGFGPKTLQLFQTDWVVFTVTDHCGFTAQDSVQIIVNPLPVINFPETLSVGCAQHRVTFNAGLSNISSYNWTFGNGLSSTLATPNTLYQFPGTYQVSLSVVSNKGCKSIGQNKGLVIVNPSPIAELLVTPKVVDTDNPVVTGLSASSGVTDQLWLISDGGMYSGGSFTHTFQDWGKFMVELAVENQFGCVDTARDEVEVKPVLRFNAPNAFTPSGIPNDGFYDPEALNNDIFYLKTAFVKEFHMTIHNRWGEVVFETFDPAQGWNGYYKGELAPMAMYVWRADIEYVTGLKSIETGDVTLLR